MDARHIRLRPAFAFQFALANAGAFAGCLPVLVVLVPLKAKEVSPADSSDVLSWAIMTGALVASVVNILAGALSDRTRTRFGRRKPWILAGALCTVASFRLVYEASSAQQLVIAVAVFQAAFNMMLPALVALLPDEVPHARKGIMAALLAVGAPLGLGIGSFLIGFDGLTFANRFEIAGGLMLLGILPLLAFWGESDDKDEPAVAKEPSACASVPADKRWKDFWRIWWSRLCIQIAFSITQGYLLFFLISAQTHAGVLGAAPPETLLGRLFLISTGLSLFAAVQVGALTDWIGRRKIFVVASGVFVGAGMSVMAAWPVLIGFITGQVLYGIGVGLYSSAEVALAAELLPEQSSAARDLGILNVGNALPQAIAPGLALILLGEAPTGYQALFLAGALFAVAGGLIVGRIQTAR